MKNFNEFGLPQELLNSLTNMGFETPTPIQAESLPHALAGRDVLGSAQTGTGKTAAFGLPLIAKLMASPQSMALIMAPTRELATQVLELIHKLLGRNSKIKTALLIGGEPYARQFSALRMKPRIIVGTPGRITDHIERETLNLKPVDFLVLDEIDRMLDMGFGIQIERIIKYIQSERQTMMFSATMPKEIVQMAEKYLNDAVRIKIGDTSRPIEKIKQEVIEVAEIDKYSQLVTQLDQRTGSIIVFVKTKRSAEKIAVKLNDENHSVSAIHGDLRQSKRERVIKAFRSSRVRIMIATDVAARGLDIPHIEHVINYDLPQCPEDYIHRIGRTARAGAEGAAVNLVSKADGSKWRAILRLLNPGNKDESGSGSSGSGFRSSRSGSGGRNRRGDSKPANFNGKGKLGFKFGRNKKRSDDAPEVHHDDNGFKKPEARSSEHREQKPRNFDRPRREGGDRPFGDRPRRSEGGDRPSFGDRPRRDGARGDRPFNDRPRRSEGGDRPFGDRPRRAEGREDRPFNDRPFNDRPRRSEGGDRPFGDRPRREGGDRPFNDRPRREGGDRPFGDRPRRSSEGGVRVLKASFGASKFGKPRIEGERGGERRRDSGRSEEAGSRTDSKGRSFEVARAPRSEERSYGAKPRRSGGGFGKSGGGFRKSSAPRGQRRSGGGNRG